VHANSNASGKNLTTVTKKGTIGAEKTTYSGRQRKSHYAKPGRSIVRGSVQRGYSLFQLPRRKRAAFLPQGGMGGGEDKGGGHGPPTVLREGKEPEMIRLHWSKKKHLLGRRKNRMIARPCYSPRTNPDRHERRKRGPERDGKDMKTAERRR